MTMEADGVLLIDKPTGCTSHDVVDYVRHRFRFKKVGHCGTLEPLATGLLMLVIGKATKIQDLLMAEDKEYAGTMKLGAVIIPASTLLGPADLADRITRGDVRHVIAESGHTPKFGGLAGTWTRVAIGDPAAGDPAAGWHQYDDAFGAPRDFGPDGPTMGSDPLLLYFTSGTTAQPKLVEHTHVSYPAGHLSTMYWIGLQPGDVHLNISSPGWAKHAWSNLFAPWNAQATILILNQSRFNAAGLLTALGDCGVTSFCAPPTVWRMLIQADLGAADVSVLPSSNLTPDRRVNVTLLLSLLNCQLVARSGTTWRLELRVTSGWYTRPRACRSRKLVAICGSSFCTLEVLAITKGVLVVLGLELDGVLLPLELQAARPILSATSAAAGAPRRDSEARGMFPPGGGGARERGPGRWM